MIEKGTDEMLAIMLFFNFAFSNSVFIGILSIAECSIVNPNILLLLHRLHLV